MTKKTNVKTLETRKEIFYFNPLYGPEEIVVESVKNTLIDLLGDASDFYKNMAATTLENGIKVVKRVHGNKASLHHLAILLDDKDPKAREILRILPVSLTRFESLDGSLAPFDTFYEVEEKQYQENRELKTWFLEDYYSGKASDTHFGTLTWKNTEGLRSVLNRLLESRKIRIALGADLSPALKLSPISLSEFVEGHGVFDKPVTLYSSREAILSLFVKHRLESEFKARSESTDTEILTETVPDDEQQLVRTLERKAPGKKVFKKQVLPGLAVLGLVGTLGAAVFLKNKKGKS